MNFHYSPLPKSVKLSPSAIDGIGIFAVDYILEDSLIGITHVEDDSGYFQNNLIRTPLAGFLNHSDTPNAVLIQSGKYYHLWTVEEVYPNYEITVDYRLYKCGE